jgi:threonine dehydrogenase-like Zn-dependent dehydrogenase
MTLQDVPGPKLLGDDWVVLRSRMTGICGSDTKQVFMDMGGDEWRDAFETLAKQHDTGAIKVAFDFRDQQ